MPIPPKTQKLGTKYVLCGELVKDYQDKSPTEKREFIKQFLTNEDKTKFDTVVAALTATDEKSEQPSDKKVDGTTESKKDDTTSAQSSGDNVAQTGNKVEGTSSDKPVVTDKKDETVAQPTSGDNTNQPGNKVEGTSSQPSGNTEHKVGSTVPSNQGTPSDKPVATDKKDETVPTQPSTSKKVDSEGTPSENPAPVPSDGTSSQPVSSQPTVGESTSSTQPSGNTDQPVTVQPSVNPEPKKDETVSAQPTTEVQPSITVEPVTVEQGTNKEVSYTVDGTLANDVLTFETTGNKIGMTVMSETAEKKVIVSATDDAAVTLTDNPLVYKIMNDGKQVGTLTVTVIAKTTTDGTSHESTGSAEDHTESNTVSSESNAASSESTESHIVSDESHTEGSHTEGSHTESDATHNEGSKPHVVSLNYVEDEVKNSFQIKQGETKVFHYVPTFSDQKEHDASDTNVDQTFAAPEDYVTHFKKLGITITPDFVNRTITISASDTASVENDHSYYFGEANGNLIFGVVSKES